MSGVLWSCACGALNPSHIGTCEACDQPRGRRAHAAQPATPPSAPPPPRCTLEQNQQAAKILRDMLTRTITSEEGQRRMGALFGEGSVPEEA